MRFCPFLLLALLLVAAVVSTDLDKENEGEYQENEPRRKTKGRKTNQPYVTDDGGIGC